MPPVKYILYFNIYNSVCEIYVNDVAIFYNQDRKGLLTSGINITPFLENGKNSLSARVTGLGIFDGDTTYPADAQCDIYIMAATPNNEKEIVRVRATATATEDLKPTGLLSPDYQGKEGANPVKEMMVENSPLRNISRDFNMTQLPDWAWTKAAPFESTPENIEKLQQAYLDISELFLAKNGEGIQEAAKISFSEKEAAEGLTASFWYQSLGFEDKLPRIVATRPIDWEGYELLILNNGRLVKLDKRGNPPPPLRFLDSEGKFVVSYAPYFSLIDGKLVITR